MYLSEFAEQRGQKPDTVAKYIRDHAAEFEGHTSMIGKQKVLDDVALLLLDKKYPLPKPVVILQNEERIKELEQKLLDKAEEINGYLLELREADKFRYQLGVAKTQMALLEAAEQEKADRISKLEADIDRRDDLLDEEKQAHQNTASELADTQKQLADTQQELERMKNRSLWQRIFNK